MQTTFYSDNGKPCYGCQGTIHKYTVDDTVSLIDVDCICCKRRDLIARPLMMPHPQTAAEVSAIHRAIGDHGLPGGRTTLLPVTYGRRVDQEEEDNRYSHVGRGPNENANDETGM